MDTNEDIIRFWKKIELNSYLPCYANNYFIMHDQNQANQITEAGQEILKETQDKILKWEK